MLISRLYSILVEPIRIEQSECTGTEYKRAPDRDLDQNNGKSCDLRLANLDWRLEALQSSKKIGRRTPASGA
jgi:hypothetical protein